MNYRSLQDEFIPRALQNRFHSSAVAFSELLTLRQRCTAKEHLTIAGKEEGTHLAETRGNTLSALRATGNVFANNVSLSSSFLCTAKSMFYGPKLQMLSCK